MRRCGVRGIRCEISDQMTYLKAGSFVDRHQNDLEGTGALLAAIDPVSRIDIIGNDITGYGTNQGGPILRTRQPHSLD